MFGVAISLTFGLNITFNWGTPPMADYMFFFSDTTHPYFYIANYFYQLYLFVIIAIGGVAVEGAFILLTLFIEARFTFTRRLIGLLDSDGYEGGNGDGAAVEKTDRLRLIDTMIDVHSDVLGYVCVCVWYGRCKTQLCAPHRKRTAATNGWGERGRGVVGSQEHQN